MEYHFREQERREERTGERAGGGGEAKEGLSREVHVGQLEARLEEVVGREALRDVRAHRALLVRDAQAHRVHAVPVVAHAVRPDLPLAVAAQRTQSTAPLPLSLPDEYE